jgi:polysaccharide export outer membrane protein
MPVRSKGSLLAGTASFAGLILAGLGCHSSPSDHDAFSIPNTTNQPNGVAVSQGDVGKTRVGYVAQPVVHYGSTPAAAPTAAPVILQSVPLTSQAPVGTREVIASTFAPVQRVSAEQVVSGPDLQAGTPPMMVSTPLTPARLPAGTPMPVGNGQVVIPNGDTASGNIMLPPPRPLLGSTGNAFVMSAGPMMPPPGPPHPSLPREFEKMALPPYVVEPPDLLLIQASDRITLRLQRITGQHLVAPDGTINLGIYGRIRVAGMTLDQVADVVAARLLEIMPGLQRGIKSKVDEKGEDVKDSKDSAELWKEEFQQQGYNPIELLKKEMQVDVLSYNSKFYYIITDGGGYGQQVYPIPITGNETVLDALAKVNGLPPVSDKRKVWVARATRAGQPPKILPVDWIGVAKCGSSETNYQLFPGDRVYVDSCSLIKADSFLAKLYSPVLRTFGVTLLGAATVNTIKSGSSSGLGGAGGIR